MRRRFFMIAAIVGTSPLSPAVAADRMAILDYGSDRTAKAGYAGATLSLLRSREGQALPVLRLGAGIRHKLNSNAPVNFKSRQIARLG